MSGDDLRGLEADVRFHRARLARFRVRRRSARPAPEARFRDVERAAGRAEGRLLHARRRSAHLN